MRPDRAAMLLAVLGLIIGAVAYDAGGWIRVGWVALAGLALTEMKIWLRP